MTGSIGRLGVALLGAALAFLVFPRAAAAGDYAVNASELKVQANARGVAPIVISATGGWHLNEQAPLWLKLNAPDGLMLGKAKLERADLAESTKERARFDVALTAAGTLGKRTVEGEVFFVLCQDQACRPITTKVSLAVEVVATTAAAEPQKTSKKPAKK